MAVLISLWALVTVLKFTVFNYRFDSIIPATACDVTVKTSAKGYGADIKTVHFLAQSEVGQTVRSERIDGDFSQYEISLQEGNRSIEFSWPRHFGPASSSIQMRCRLDHVKYNLPEKLTHSVTENQKFAPYLKTTELIQHDDSVIAKQAALLGIESEENIIAAVKRIYEYVYTGIKPAAFSAETDAVLTCKLGEASCNGKSRLMVALCRRIGIPSRLVGGIILTGTSGKRTSHQWVEVRIGDNWIPFCPLNGYFAEKPDTYLALYRGDHAMFRHTKEIHFNYGYHFSKRLVPREDDYGGHKALDIISIWKTFEHAGIPLNLLSIILVVPLGALVTIIFRNVVGVQTFGTFLPALIAYAFQSTGLWWGIVIFTSIIMLGSVLDSFLSKLKLLHTPRLTIIMVFIVACLIVASVTGVRLGNVSLAGTFFFPLAILSITTERFFIVATERGKRRALEILFWSMVVVAFCYMVMSSLFLQMMMVVMPETYLLIVAAALYIGHWTGLRVSEFSRFRHLIKAEGAGHVQ